MAQQVFSCGKCLTCRKQRATELACRCVLHASLYQENCFLTLTYDEKLDGYHNNFQYKDIQDFKKRLRQLVWRKHQQRTQIFNVHEYGKNGKKHWHLIVFNFGFPDRHKNPGSIYYNSPTLLKLWPYGHHSIGDVNEASAMYQAQYMEKDFKHDYVTSKKRSHSKHSGLGRPYFLLHYMQLLRLGYIPFNGTRVPVPRYFEKLAHRHYCHFYDPQAFVDTKIRKAKYRPFKKTELPSLEIATAWLDYKKRKDAKILDLSNQWDDVISHHLTTKETPDFIKSDSNKLYDLRNKTNNGDF